MTDYIITEKAGRIVAGRQNHGVGTTLSLSDDEAREALEAGQIVPVPVDAEEDGEAQDPPPALADMTKAELLALASGRGVEADEKQTKAEIIAAIEAKAAEAGAGA